MTTTSLRGRGGGVPGLTDPRSGKAFGSPPECQRAAIGRRYAMRTRMGLLAGAMLAVMMVIGVVSVASGSSSGHLRAWGLQPGVTPQKAAVPHAAGTTQLVVLTRNEHAVDVDEPPAGFPSQGDESTTS